MEHVAIMKKSWGLTKKILTGQKKIESRWYMARCAPWDRVKAGETVYFKDSGEPVEVKAEISKVIQFADLTPGKVKDILRNYGENDGIGIDKINNFFERFKDKRYCILVFLTNPVSIKPFNVDKTGFGLMSAWITADSIKKLKIK